MAPPSILIVGCGIAGPILATFLLLSDTPAAEKPHVTILERASSVRIQGQNVDIRGAGMTIMRKLGLESTIRANLTNEEGAMIVDGSNRVWGAFGVDKSGKSESGTAEIEIMRGKLGELCYKRSKSVSDEVQSQGGAGVEYVFGDYLESIEQDDQNVHVRFANSGEQRTFDIVVGADGLQSRTRKMVFGEAGEKDRVFRVGMYAAFFSMAKTDRDSRWRRWYNAPGRRALWIRPTHIENKVSAFINVVSDGDERLPEVAKMGQKGVEAQKALMNEYFRGTGWESERILKEMNASKDFYYDMVAQVKMDKFSKGRIVLLADAGYCASPISGMGTTLALQGAYTLAGALSQHSAIDDHTKAFEVYEERMRPIVQIAQKLPFGGPPRGAPHLITPETWWGIWIMRGIVAAIYWSGVIQIVTLLVRPKPASSVPVLEYGFRQLDEWKET